MRARNCFMTFFNITDFGDGMMKKVQFGIEIDSPNFEYTRKVTLQSEALGFDSIWIYDARAFSRCATRLICAYSKDVERVWRYQNE